MTHDVAWILGQDSEQQLLVSTWVTRTQDHGDAAQLLLHPAGHGTGRAMAEVAGAAGLGPADGDMTTVDPSTCRALLAADGARLVISGHQLKPTPYRPDWGQAASRHGLVVVLVGMDPWTGRDVDLDDYLRRTRRLHAGLVTVEQSD